VDPKDRVPDATQVRLAGDGLRNYVQDNPFSNGPSLRFGDRTWPIRPQSAGVGGQNRIPSRMEWLQEIRLGQR